MRISEIYTNSDICAAAKQLFTNERAKNRLDGWFLTREMFYELEANFAQLPLIERNACVMKEILTRLPLTIDENAVFAGTQDDAFARSYALINPSFKVESFAGYCDPTAVFGDIEPNDEFPAQRIEKVREQAKNSRYCAALADTYAAVEDYTGEVVFFMEQVTGHLIPDFRAALKNGVGALIAHAEARISGETDEGKRSALRAMKTMLEGVILLAHRYAALAQEKAEAASGAHKQQLLLMAETLRKVPEQGAGDLYEAMQSYLLLWQVMCLEQAPNPFAFSVGNVDRIFEPYRVKCGADRDTASALFRHFLVFYNVADRSWAISQNIIVGGRDVAGTDLSSVMTYAVLDAYYDMNLPQPILSVKLHRNTPDTFYAELGRFFFTPGCLTPSFFNDDSVFEVLRRSGVEEQDLPGYSIAGCQEMLIMGKDNANTTNSWLNLAKILELTLSGGVSTVTGKVISRDEKLPAAELLSNVRTLFYRNAEKYIRAMTDAANGCSKAVSLLPVPFLSAFMGGLESGIDTRDTRRQGTRYNGSGCLIHGLSVIADSFAAIDHLMAERPQDADRLLKALTDNFEGDEELRQYLLSCPKYGNNIAEVDDIAVGVANRISDMIGSFKNYLGNPFRADWSSPSTHLLYGYWVGATPDGRKSRDMLGYGIDPLYGEATNGLGFRVLSAMKLPFEKFNGGYASHFGIDPKYFRGQTLEEKGLEFKTKIMKPLFFNDKNAGVSPFYLYVNVTTPEILRKVLANPKKYAPSGVYIMRIHGTFVNFLDLSPAIQNDIITRLDLQSTACC